MSVGNVQPVVRSRSKGRALMIAGALTLVPACHVDEHGNLATPASSASSASGTSSPSGVSTSQCSLPRVVSAWRLRRLAWQTVVVPVEETDVAAVGGPVASGAGGVILFGNTAPANLGTALRQLTARAPGGVRPLVMTDEEGGFVQRMANLVGSMPTARTMGATMTPHGIRRLAHRVGLRMASAAVTMNLAPVLDLDNGSGPNSTDAIGTRSFSINADVATAAGLAFARGMRGAGVVPVVKHFPGLGGATANTDIQAASTRPWAELKSNDLKPFRAAIAAGMPAVMTSNAHVPGLTPMPASLSFAANGFLRNQLGFHRLVITDSLSAGAISDAGYDVPRATVRALKVGADMVLFNADPGQVTGAARAMVHAIVVAVQGGRLARSRLETAAVHVLRAKHVDLCG
jgi:beta-N-acetylhexosaminidase